MQNEKTKKIDLLTVETISTCVHFLSKFKLVLFLVVSIVLGSQMSRASGKNPSLYYEMTAFNNNYACTGSLVEIDEHSDHVIFISADHCLLENIFLFKSYKIYFNTYSANDIFQSSFNLKLDPTQIVRLFKNFAGGSGSPVLNSSGELIGILNSGQNSNTKKISFEPVSSKNKRFPLNLLYVENTFIKVNWIDDIQNTFLIHIKYDSAGYLKKTEVYLNNRTKQISNFNRGQAIGKHDIYDLNNNFVKTCSNSSLINLCLP